MTRILTYLLGFSLPAFAAVDKTPTVFVKSSALVEMADDISYPARTEAKVNAVVLAETEGVVTRIHAPLGRAVKRRESLLVIQQTDPVYKYAPAPVPSPVPGVVSSMEVTEGSRVVKGQRLAAVTDPKSLRISVEVPAQDIASINPEMNASFELSGAEKPVAMKLRGISPHVDLATGTATAEFEAADAADSTRLRPGMVGKLRLRVNVRQALSVPEDAVVYRKGQTFLRIVEQGKARSVPVVLGRRGRGRVEIVRGLKEKMQVIERASGFVAEGETVKVQTEDMGS